MSSPPVEKSSKKAIIDFLSKLPKRFIDVARELVVEVVAVVAGAVAGVLVAIAGAIAGGVVVAAAVVVKVAEGAGGVAAAVGGGGVAGVIARAAEGAGEAVAVVVRAVAVVVAVVIAGVLAGVLAAVMAGVVAVEIVGVIAGILAGVEWLSTGKTEKPKNISLSKKLNNLPEDYIGEFQALESRLKRQGLSEKEMEEELNFYLHDLLEAHRQCLRENWLEDMKRRISSLFA